MEVKTDNGRPVLRLLTTIPTNNIGIGTIFGEKRKGYFKEGLRLRWPFEKIWLYPLEPIRIDGIKAEATSKDNLKLFLDISFEFCYDPSILDKNGICVLSQYDSDDVIIKGITDELRVNATSIIGVSTAGEINAARKEINMLLNVISRLPDKNTPTLHPSEVIAHYKTNFKKVSKNLGEEHLNTDHSRLEERYGVDITRVDVVIDYSKEALDILKENKAAEEESLVSKKILETTEDFKKAGISPDKAASNALLIYKKDSAKLEIKDVNIAGLNQLPGTIETIVKTIFGKKEVKDA
ncbi:MAG: SPFH domain-containing protein [Patescibacteria group bacterium]|nr:SPFH domain-containing protein [Patescibacteria group bacterium]